MALKNVMTPLFRGAKSTVLCTVSSRVKTSLRAMRRGLSTVVPMADFNLTASEFQVLCVCVGDRLEISQTSKYENYRKSSRVRWFWKIFREMSQQERSLFIKYVWGRQRLPRGNEV